MVDIVRCDSEEGAYQLVRHLLDLGHRRIAVLTGPESVSTAVQRVFGYRRALREVGLGKEAEWVRYGRFTQASGAEGTREMLALDPRPTALLAANNFIAVGALGVLREAGVDVPRDLSLVCFDDPTCDPASASFLTVVDQPAYQMGQCATELLIDRLTSMPANGFQEIILPTELLVRHSSGPVCERESLLQVL
jgi:DNA-binding LacI/PurR family transcriptional regulator